MKKYDTPQPIKVEVEIVAGDVRVAATERTDTVVEVLPTNSANPDDVAAAAQTRVDFTGDCLSVKRPRSRRRFNPFNDGGSVSVNIEVPAGSRLVGETAKAAVNASGRLSDCRFSSAFGALTLDQVGTLVVRTAHGDVNVGVTTGTTDVTSASGALRIGTMSGAANFKTAHGDLQIGEVRGDLRVKAANGSVNIDRAGANVVARTAHGNVRVREIVRGSVSAQTAFGDIEIGVGDGTAAYLDLHAHRGRVETSLGSTDEPKPGEQTVEVVARTSMGNISVHRAAS